VPFAVSHCLRKQSFKSVHRNQYADIAIPRAVSADCTAFVQRSD
jgi:hypothetical protein